MTKSYNRIILPSKERIRWLPLCLNFPIAFRFSNPSTNFNVRNLFNICLCIYISLWHAKASMHNTEYSMPILDSLIFFKQVYNVFRSSSLFREGKDHQALLVIWWRTLGSLDWMDALFCCFIIVITLCWGILKDFSNSITYWVFMFRNDRTPMTIPFPVCLLSTGNKHHRIWLVPGTLVGDHIVIPGVGCSFIAKLLQLNYRLIWLPFLQMFLCFYFDSLLRLICWPTYL